MVKTLQALENLLVMDVITKSINNYYGKANFHDQKILKSLQSLYHDVESFDDDDVAPEELINRYNEI